MLRTYILEEFQQQIFSQLQQRIRQTSKGQNSLVRLHLPRTTWCPFFVLAWGLLSVQQCGRLAEREYMQDRTGCSTVSNPPAIGNECMQYRTGPLYCERPTGNGNHHGMGIVR